MARALDLTASAARFAGWVPARVDREGARPVVDWCHLGGRRFVEPSFDDTIQQCMREPFNLVFRHRTPIDTLADWHARSPGLPLSGVIAHTSRCGSTLVARMLAALPNTVVLAEPGPLDTILRARPRDAGPSEDEQIDWVRWIVSALGQRRRDDDRYLFVKLDCWDTALWPLVRRAFPGVPSVFLYREPVEVLVSQLNRRGAHMVPGVIEPELFGFSTGAMIEMTPEEFGARVLASICEAGLEHHSAGGRLVNYAELPGAVSASLLDLFGVEYSAADVDTLARVAQRDAKNPSLGFDDDSERKHRAATELVRSMADKWVRPVYERLEGARVASSATLSGSSG